ncbi:SpaA isopeptide-forming pilin-related protein [Bifidobacterium simiarum]|uniref:SpaA isopeptide-forming pilin-related protein n=1 Tax=Bifidobacterium simiarum TaxID=2045441 RepID=UPI001BDD1658|nr:FctA domain-containing protein [Bifidobacterium simiarum]MBT1165656.1 hypothetical protein [Bifidobacterium simiarum]
MAVAGIALHPAVAAVSDHTVQGLTPAGTTTDLFDYWLSNRNSNDNTDPGDPANYGINQGKQLIFTSSGYGAEGGNLGSAAPNTASINSWTGKSTSNVGGPYQGIVNANLGDDGYPTLASGNYYKGNRSQNNPVRYLNTDTSVRTGNQSLNYLFNTESGTAKKAYSNVKGLMQLNDDGYYYYDSQRNFASFSADASDSTGSFTLYDKPAVNSSNSVADQQSGQFFPFNTADQVFQERNGQLTSDASSTDADIRHLFGMHSKSTFVQPVNGMVNDNRAMTYEFSGDDDVWVYIDGVLVGDVGGIHDRLTLSIDFSTGRVQVKDGASYRNANNPHTYIDTTLKAAFTAAGKTGETSFRGNTFADGTYHTLDFFYLERGAGNSNMKLMYNLVQPPTSDIIKVDQGGDPVAGAQFALYSTGADFSTANRQPLATGVTAMDTDGTSKLVLRDASGTVIDFDKRYGNDSSADKANSTYYVLRETSAPAGYSRMINDMQLKYVTPSRTSSGVKSGTLVSWPTADSKDSPVWKTGGVAKSKESIVAESSFTTADAGSPCVNDCTTKDVVESGRQLFAVVLKYDGTGDVNDRNNWRAVTGNMLDGWTQADGTGRESVVNALKGMTPDELKAHTFALQSSGKYEMQFDDLPGYVSDYYYMLADKTKAKYRMEVYYSDATSVNGLTANNIFPVETDGFTRTFSSRFYVPNIKNELFVQKVDDVGNTLSGVPFDLYKADQVDVTEAADGTVSVTPKSGVSDPYDTVTTGDQWVNDGKNTTPNLAGANMFPSDLAKAPLTNGTYYLVERAAPAGYVKNAKATKVIVNDSGIYANAGVKGDGIKVIRGVGQLVSTMSTFGSTGSTDDTLRYVKTFPGTITEAQIGAGQQGGLAALHPAAAGTDGKVTINDTASTKPLSLMYGGRGAALQYGPLAQGGDYLFAGDEGWPVIRTSQDDRPAGQTADERTELDKSTTGADGQGLSALVTGSVTVQVTNDREAPKVTLTNAIKVRKTVEGRAAAGDFTFTLQPTAPTTADGIDGLTDGKTAVSVSKDDLAASGASQTATFGDLTFTVPAGSPDTYTKDYTFTITENDADKAPAGWGYDRSAYEVTVHVAKNADSGKWEATVTSFTQTKDFGGNAIAAADRTQKTDHTADFTNRYATVSSLPLTGGDATGRLWMIVGGGLAAAALAAGFGLTEYRRRKGAMA